MLEDFEVPNTIQPREYSRGGGADGMPHIIWAVNANWNGNGWNVNANSVENPYRWDDGNQVLARYPLLSSACAAEVLLIRPLLQPPTIFPSSSIAVPREMNLSLGMRRVSHKSCVKKRSESILSAVFSRSPIFVVICEYADFLRSSRRSKNRKSILVPMPKRSVRGRLRCKGIQSLYTDLAFSKIGKLLRRGGDYVEIFIVKVQLGHKFEDIISVENLLEAWREFSRGKRGKRDVQEFQFRLMDNILSLHEDLASGAYRHGGYLAFKINDPKPRDIHKATVRDRLLHHAIYRILYPFFDRTFIAGSFSCRNGKGTHAALNRFRSFAHAASKNNTRTCLVLKCDIRKFFANIDHGVLMEITSKYTADGRLLWLLKEIIDSFSSGQTSVGLPRTKAELSVRGLPLGNLTSQLFVNIYMNEFYQFVKHRLKIRHYIRYADDFVILSPDNMWLEAQIPQIERFLREQLRLRLHPQKVFIKTFASGVDFLGWVHFPDHRVLRTATKKRMIKRMSEPRSINSLNSYLGLLGHGNTNKLERRLLENCLKLGY